MRRVKSLRTSNLISSLPDMPNKKLKQPQDCEFKSLQDSCQNVNICPRGILGVINQKKKSQGPHYSSSNKMIPLYSQTFADHRDLNESKILPPVVVDFTLQPMHIFPYTPNKVSMYRSLERKKILERVLRMEFIKAPSMETW